eukprot:Protomagalhaensia_sp_Gyna_25__4089@NODE_36_length_6784_cov_145_152706_g25_i0_p8_GENE_NODE_36_length_6784_cov_145_152706_g25_i0NODE_36_length_6784_cov_145_152706_g25_i0_p8_ORF_typecomplete_len105_score7_06_NODE_36_length_6784_cov_145_152706_g25_i057756089
MAFHARVAKPLDSLSSDLILFYQRGAFVREKAPREIPVAPVMAWPVLAKPPGSHWTSRSAQRAFAYPLSPAAGPFAEPRIYAPADICHVQRGSVSSANENRNQV